MWQCICHNPGLSATSGMFTVLPVGTSTVYLQPRLLFTFPSFNTLQSSYAWTEPDAQPRAEKGYSSVINTRSNGTKNTPIPQITKIKTNHPPDAFSQTIVVDNLETRSIELRGNDIDDDPITFSTTSNPTHGQLASFNPNTGVITYT